ncbi:phosphoserine phosphatase SerB [Rickettsiales bacterium]|nr:phosphoserine phosphatase SerB [Rickettsiales bacterium]
MQNVTTLIYSPDSPKLYENIINKAFKHLEKKGAVISGFKWLSKNEACDITYSDLDPENASIILKEKFEGLPIDIISQKTDNRRKKLLISDMDSTIIQQECIDELADNLGLKDKVAQITERAMNGELDFSESLRERVALLKDLDEAQLKETYDKKIQLMPGAKTLLKTMRENDAYCLLVSGGFTYFTSKIKDLIGFNEDHANILQIIDGKLTGKVIEPILDKDSKLKTLNLNIDKLKISVNDTIAVGDGANDLPMLLGAGIGIAYHAKESVKAKANFSIDHGDLTALLFAQGFSKKEFKEDEQG